MEITQQNPTVPEITEQNVEAQNPPDNKEINMPPELSKEQQQFAESFDKATEEATQKVVEARQSAGDKLQKLHGKDLVVAGFKQAFYGATTGSFTRIVSAGVGSVYGGLTGGLAGGMYDTLNALNNHKTNTMREAAGVGTAIGAMAGYVAGQEHADKLYQENIGHGRAELESNKFDWTVGSVGPITLLKPGKLRALGLVINPTSVAGVRHMAEGFVQMGQDVVANYKIQQALRQSVQPNH